jgi:hypothetical protein
MMTTPDPSKSFAAESESADGTPVCHPDRRNWRPGDDDAADELQFQKLQDAIRDGASERAIAKLLGLNRAQMWRAKMASQVPKELLERLLAARVGHREIVGVGRALKDGELLRRDVECCPNCGHRLRLRPAIKQSTIKIVADWMDEKDAAESAATAQPSADAAKAGG